MGTVVSMQVVGHDDTDAARAECAAAVARAEQWFRHIEHSCNRFDPDSEVRKLAMQRGTPHQASELLLQAVQFALAVAEESGGAFDPTVGQRMEALGFDRAYQTGAVTRSALPELPVSYRDVSVDVDAGTITLRKPLLLDLGAVVKGLAIDLAARELAPLAHFQINAGGDVYVGGRNPAGEPWRVGIQHPRDTHALVATLAVTNCAVCTSGDYERRSAVTGASHIVHAPSGRPATTLASVTVVAPSAMVADALSTAAFAMGADEGRALLERHGVEALFVAPTLESLATKGLPVV